MKYSVKTIFLNDIVLNGKVKGDGIMKRTFGVVLAILCMFTLSFSGVFASQTPVAKGTEFCVECGAEIPFDSVFCQECGADLGNEG